METEQDSQNIMLRLLDLGRKRDEGLRGFLLPRTEPVEPGKTYAVMVYDDHGGPWLPMSFIDFVTVLGPGKTEGIWHCRSCHGNEVYFEAGRLENWNMKKWIATCREKDPAFDAIWKRIDEERARETRSDSD